MKREIQIIFRGKKKIIAEPQQVPTFLTSLVDLTKKVLSRRQAWVAQPSCAWEKLSHEITALHKPDPSPGLALVSASPTTRAPPLLLSCTVGGLGTLLSPSRWNPPSDQALSLELKLSSSNSEPASLCSYPPSPLPYECPAFTWVPPGTGNSPSPGQFW